MSEEIYLLQPSLNKLEKIIFSEIPSEPVTLSDFKYESGSPIGLVILGNHEYIGFANVEDKNKRILSEDKALYADNQIGYHNNGKFDGTICFKSASMDPATNPYIDFKDGYYQTTTDAYFQFCDYVGENIGYADRN